MVKALGALMCRKYSFTDEDHSWNPFPLYEMMRERGPVVLNDELGVYFVTGYDDLVSVLRQSDIFSSGIHAGWSSKRPTVQKVLDELYTEAPVLSHADGEIHKRQAKIVKPFFTPKKMRALAPHIRQIAEDCISEFESEDVEFVEAFSVKLSMRVLCQLLDFPIAENDLIRRGSDAYPVFHDGVGDTFLSEADGVRMARDLVEFQKLIADEITRRQHTDADDLISAVLRGLPQDMSDEERQSEVYSLVMLLVSAGNETVRGLISSAALHLALDNSLIPRVRDDADFRRAFIEETLRVEPPVMFLYRVATQDTAVHGVPIAKGAKVCVAYCAANRDEYQFKNAGEFDPGRGGRQHISFGFGAHFCIGAPLARLEADIGLEELLRRYSMISLLDDGRDYAPSPHLRHHDSLHLRLTAASDIRVP
jgi:cytochrome P450